MQKEEFSDLIFNIPEVRKKIIERGERFQDYQKQYDQFKSAKTPEPHLKIQGGPYKNPNLIQQKNEVLLNLRDEMQSINREISHITYEKLSSPDYGIEKQDIKDFDIQEGLDEKIAEHNLQHSKSLYTNKEINRYLDQRGIRPDKSRDADKPMDKEPEKHILSQMKQNMKDQEVLKNKEPQPDKNQPIQKNKKDMDIDHEPDI
ncbi:MAG: hypothetical protein ABJF04_09330 [Reichenbachiella sp.]|uniref:hypothetical protein n=1 Tax=Reichenbachiella sp. TaxID=2184521 RepID=UPI0032676AEF